MISVSAVPAVVAGLSCSAFILLYTNIVIIVVHFH